MDPDLTDRLALRLSALDISTPTTLIPRVLAACDAGARPARGHRSTLVTALAALVLLIAGNVGASYFSPRYAQALADAPGAGALTGPILQQAGLASPVGAVPLDLRSTASGYTVRVFGAYADGVRTTVFIQILGPDGREAPDGTAPAFTTSLTDQFGHTYHIMNGFGMPVIHFEPLVWPASSVGARLTLHIESLSVIPSPAAAVPPTTVPGATKGSEPGTSGSVITGPWTLDFTLTAAGGQDLALPPAVQLSDTSYTFTAVRSTSSLLEVSWRITGGAVTRQQQLAEEMGRYGASPPVDLLSRQKANFDEVATSKLLDSDGRTIDPIYGSGHTIRQDGKDVALVMDAWFPISLHGRYRFQVSESAPGQDMRNIDIP